MRLRTLEDLRDEVADILAVENISPLPGPARIVRALNRAKNDVAAKLEPLRPDLFTWRLDGSVEYPDSFITLPNGSDPLYPAVRRILGVTLLDGDAEVRVPVYARNDPRARESDLWFYWEQGALWFGDLSGPKRTLRFRLRYAGLPGDLTVAQGDAYYQRIPDEWADVMVFQAALDMLPTGPAFARWRGRRDERLNELLRSNVRPVDDGPIRVRRFDEDFD